LARSGNAAPPASMQPEAYEKLARTLIDQQDPAGFWTGHSSDNPAAETARSLQLLHATPRVGGGGGSVTNVTSQVSITTTGFLLSRSTNTYNGTLTVKNTGASVIAGPITIGLPNLTAGVTLTNGNGTFNGDPYVTAIAASMNPGDSASVALRFSKTSSNLVITSTPVAYSGTFPPAALNITCPTTTATQNTSY